MAAPTVDEALTQARAELVRAWDALSRASDEWLTAECAAPPTADQRAERARLREAAERARETIRLALAEEG